MTAIGRPRESTADAVYVTVAPVGLWASTVMFRGNREHEVVSNERRAGREERRRRLRRSARRIAYFVTSMRSKKTTVATMPVAPMTPSSSRRSSSARAPRLHGTAQAGVSASPQHDEREAERGEEEREPRVRGRSCCPRPRAHPSPALARGAPRRPASSLRRPWAWAARARAARAAFRFASRFAAARCFASARRSAAVGWTTDRGGGDRARRDGRGRDGAPARETPAAGAAGSASAADRAWARDADLRRARGR